MLLKKIKKFGFFFLAATSLFFAAEVTTSHYAYNSSIGNGYDNVGSLTIKTLEAKSFSLVSGASYLITPNPKTGSGSLLVQDGGVGDEDGSKNGLITISHVLNGKYDIRQIAIPSGFISLVSHTIKNIFPSYSNQIVAFEVVSGNTDLTRLSPVQISSPSFNNATFNLLTSSLAKIVSNDYSAIIGDTDQTPHIILAGATNPSAINESINSTVSISLNTSFAELTNGSTVINKIGLESYTLPNSTNLVSVIPTFVANINSTSGYMVVTPPTSGIVPGQKMIISIVNSLIPSFGGLEELDVEPSSAVPVESRNTTNWFVVEVDNKVPAGVGLAAPTNSTILFVNVQDPFEDNGVGVNWSDPANHAVHPTLTIIVNKTNQSSIEQDSAGCPVIDAYTLDRGAWTTSGLAELSSKSVSSYKCEITIQSQHLSKFVFSLRHVQSISSTQGLTGGGTVSTGLAPESSNVAYAISQSTPSPYASQSSPSTKSPATMGEFPSFAGPNTSSRTLSTGKIISPPQLKSVPDSSVHSQLNDTFSTDQGVTLPTIIFKQVSSVLRSFFNIF